ATMPPNRFVRWSTESRATAAYLRSLRESGELCRFRDRRLAREALAEVERRPPVDEVLAGEQGNVARRAERHDSVRVEAGERGLGDLVIRPADQCELARGRQVEVERGERVAVGAGRARNRVADQAEHSRRLPLQLVFPPDPAAQDQHERKHRVPGRGRVVVELLLARHQLLTVGRRKKDPAALAIGEELYGEPGDPVRLVEPTELPRRDVQLVE